MEVRDCIRQRRSIRKFQNQRLPDEIIRQIVDGARFAPSWANTKAIQYICIQDAALKRAIGMYCPEHNREIVEHAPQLFAVIGRKGKSGLERGEPLPYPTHTPEEWLMLDGGIAIQTLCLSAWALGVGTVVLGGYALTPLIELLGLPEDQTLITLVAAGYPDEAPVMPRRKEVQEILRII